MADPISNKDSRLRVTCSTKQPTVIKEILVATYTKEEKIIKGVGN